MKRSLSLSREVLADLTPSDLRSVVGGHSHFDYISCHWIQCVPRWAIEQVHRHVDTGTTTS